MTFAQSIDQWNDFYMSLIAASATLFGLLFIGISLNPARVAGETDYRGTALQAFTSFIYALILGFLFVIPDQSTTGLGIPLISLGIFGLLQTFGNTSTAVRSQTHLWSPRKITVRFGWPIIAFITMIIIAVTILAGQTSSLYWLVPVVLTLIGSASSNAWQLLINTPKAD